MYAGSTIIVLNGLLERFRDDIDATSDEWSSKGPSVYVLITGLSPSAGIDAEITWCGLETDAPKARGSLGYRIWCSRGL